MSSLIFNLWDLDDVLQMYDIHELLYTVNNKVLKIIFTKNTVINVINNCPESVEFSYFIYSVRPLELNALCV